MVQYHFRHAWRVDAPIERVWDVLLLADAWPTWWQGIRSVERLSAGADSGVGTRLRQRWRSPLPITLRLDLEIERVERHRLLVGRSEGDLEGTCSWEFERDGDATVVQFAMDVQPGRAWMNLPIPFANRVAAASFGAIMAQGGEGLARALTPAPSAIPATPAAPAVEAAARA